MTTKARYTTIGADALARMELTFENTDEGSRARRFLESLIALRSSKGTVYTTECEDDQGNIFVFTTTRKEIQLGLASMAQADRLEFAKMLDEELNDLGRPGLIFIMPAVGGQSVDRAMHITRSFAEGDGRVFLNLSRAA